MRASQCRSTSQSGGGFCRNPQPRSRKVAFYHLLPWDLRQETKANKAHPSTSAMGRKGHSGRAGPSTLSHQSLNGGAPGPKRTAPRSRGRPSLVLHEARPAFISLSLEGGERGQPCLLFMTLRSLCPCRISDVRTVSSCPPQ